MMCSSPREFSAGRDVETKKIAFLGDSHIQYFDYGARNGLYFPNQVKTCLVSAATVSGLRNENSFTKAAPKFRKFLQGCEKDTIPIFQLGEVDCGILIWLKVAKHKTSIDEQVAETCNIYLDFLQEVRDLGFREVAVTSATLPTILDTDVSGAVVSERRSKVKANLRQRTDLTLDFNDRLSEHCKGSGFRFIDATHRFLNGDSELCKPEFRNARRGDHHMDNMRAGVEWAAEINNHFDDLESGNITLLRANTSSYIKKLNRSSADLPSDFLCRVKPGDVLELDLVAERRGVLIARRAVLNGRVLPREYRYIWGQHYDRHEPRQ